MRRIIRNSVRLCVQLFRNGPPTNGSATAFERKTGPREEWRMKARSNLACILSFLTKLRICENMRSYSSGFLSPCIWSHKYLGPTEKHPSGAKAPGFMRPFAAPFGCAQGRLKVVPFHKPIYATSSSPWSVRPYSPPSRYLLHRQLHHRCPLAILLRICPKPVEVCPDPGLRL